MFRYHLIGNVYKDQYVISNFKEDKYKGNPFSNKDVVLGIVYGEITRNRDFNIISLDIDSFIYNESKQTNEYCNNIYDKYYKYENIEHYKKKHKIQKEELSTNHVWDRYEEFDAMETDIELKDSDTIKIQNKDYKVLYKFNKDLKRHELYLDYEINIEIDSDLKKQCEEIIETVNRRIDEYNKTVDDWEVKIDERFKEYINPKDIKMSLITRIKEWLF